MSGISVFKSVYFRNIYLTFLACFFVVGILVIIIINLHLRSSIRDRELIQIEEKLILLVPQAQKILKDLSYDHADSIFPQGFMLPKIRYTLIAPRGEVIADSHKLPETIVDGWSFPEVKLALKKEWGIDERYVPVIKEKALLIARAIRQNNKVIGIIRAELPYSVLYDLESDVKRMIMIIGLISILLVFLFGFFISRSYAYPVSEIAEVCKAISSGDYHRKVILIPKNEIGQLAMTINRLSEDVLSKISSLSVERAQLRSILSCMKEGIISLSHLGEIQFCNRSTYQHLNISSEDDLRKKNIKDVEILKIIYPIWKEVLEKKTLIIKELWIEKNPKQDQSESIHHDKKFLRIYATFYESQKIRHSYSDYVHLSGVMIVIDNHTEIKKLQQIRREFFAHVSHELKTPLTSIRGFVETLQNSELDQNTAKRFLQKIEDNTKRLMSLVMDLLSLTKIESNKNQALELVPVNWLAVIKKVSDNHAQNLKNKGLTLDIKHSKHSKSLVMGDFESMYTIFDNLLSNAIRYSHKNTKITIDFKKVNSYIVMNVTDTGVGIASEHHKAIFDRFYRVDKARSRQDGGTGLGLSIVKQLCEKISGAVELESTLDRGTTFSVKIPKAF